MSNDSPLKTGQNPSGCSSANFIRVLSFVASSSLWGLARQPPESFKSNLGAFRSAAASDHEMTSLTKKRLGGLITPALKRAKLENGPRSGRLALTAGEVFLQAASTIVYCG